MQTAGVMHVALAVTPYFGLQLMIRVSDSRYQGMDCGNKMGRSRVRDFLCNANEEQWSKPREVLDAAPKTIIRRAFLLNAGDESTGVCRKDTLLAKLQFPFTEASLSAYFEHYGLWSVFETPDPLHLILNHAPKLQDWLVNALPANVVKSIDDALLADCGTTLTRGARAGWQWRLFYASDKWETYLHNEVFALTLVQTFRQCIAAMYAPPELRTAKSLLRFAANCFMHGAIWIRMCQPMMLAEHFLLSHMPFVYLAIAPSSLLCERIESTFIPIRRIHQSGLARGEHAVLNCMEQLLTWRAAKRAITGLHTREVPVLTEPCAQCVSGTSSRRTMVKSKLFGDLGALFVTLGKLGFTAASWTMLNGDVELHDAHLDAEPRQPVLPTLQQFAAFTAVANQKDMASIFAKLADTTAQRAERLTRAADERAAMQQQSQAKGSGSGKEEKRPIEVEHRLEHQTFTDDDCMTDEDIDAFYGSDAQRDKQEKEDADELFRELADADFGPTTRSKAKRLQHVRACNQCGKSEASRPHKRCAERRGSESDVTHVGDLQTDAKKRRGST
jgi:hypothetical protein